MLSRFGALGVKAVRCDAHTRMDATRVVARRRAHARTAADAVMLGHGRRTLVRWRDRWRALTCARERDAAAERYARRRLLRRIFFHVWLNAHGDASPGERPTPPGSSGAREPDAEILRLHDRA